MPFITGIQTKKFLLLNLEKMMITKKQNADVNVSNIIIVDSPKPAEIIEDKGVGAKEMSL